MTLTNVTLTEAWAVAYLQILVVLLIFALGLPALLIQVRVPPEFQPLIQRTFRPTKLGYFFLVLVSLNALFLVLYARPTSTGPAVGWVALAAHFSVCCAFVVTVYLFLFFSRYMNIARVIKRICRKAGRGMSIPRRNRSFFNAVASLRYIGVNARADADRVEVLRALEALMVGSIDDVAHRGGRLEKCVEGICVIVELVGNRASYSVFEAAIRGLRRGLAKINRKRVALTVGSVGRRRGIRRLFAAAYLDREPTLWHRLVLWTKVVLPGRQRIRRLIRSGRRTQHQVLSDLDVAMRRLELGQRRVLRSMARSAVSRGGRRLAPLLSSSLEYLRGDPALLFEIGRECLIAYPQLITLPALLKLAVGVASTGHRSQDDEYRTRLLGLSALFAKQGASYSQWAEIRILEGLELTEDQERRAALDAARKRLLAAGEFSTADAIDDWCREIIQA